MKKIFALTVLIMMVTACGGGGSSGESPAPKPVKYIGIYTGISDYTPIQITDFSLENLTVKNLYKGNTLIATNKKLTQVKEFEGYNYQYDSNLGGVFFDQTKSHSTVIAESESVGTYQSENLPIVNITKDSINGNWEGYRYYEYRGSIYQQRITTACKLGVCEIKSADSTTKFSIDFAREFYSKFNPLGVWYGRETNGTRVFSSAVISGDGTYLSMPMCWDSFAYNNFFGACEIAVLSKLN